MSVEFHYGSQSRALELGEALIARSDIQPTVRSRAASELAWMYFDVNQIQQGNRVYAQAERAFVDLPPNVQAISAIRCRCDF